MDITSAGEHAYIGPVTLITKRGYNKQQARYCRSQIIVRHAGQSYNAHDAAIIAVSASRCVTQPLHRTTNYDIMSA